VIGVGLALAGYLLGRNLPPTAPGQERVLAAARATIAAQATALAAGDAGAGSGLASNLAGRSLGQGLSAWADVVRYNAEWEPQELAKGAGYLTPGGRGMAYQVRLEPGRETHIAVQHSAPIRADVIMALVYVPASPDIVDHWMSLAASDDSGEALAASDSEVRLGEWTRLVLDLRGKYDAENRPLNAQLLNMRVFYSLRAAATLSGETVEVGLDDVAWFTDAGHPSAKGEQQGPGRTVFSFEDVSPGGWQGHDAEGNAIPLAVSDEAAYRGAWAIKLSPDPVNLGAAVSLSTPWAGARGSVVWIAEVYIPPDAPAGADMWTGFYTLTSQGLLKGPSRPLAPGEWTTISWDTSGIDWGGADPLVGIEVGAGGRDYTGPIYVDDVQLFGR
jgi:hypothetical protein